MLERRVDDFLKNWKTCRNFMPLIIRGARQVGKTWSVRSFGKVHFTHFIEVNFERSPQYTEVFASELSPKHICKELEFLFSTPIIPGKTLLFFDEIQDCPQAITSLRYFYEEMPELHIIAAGSLLEFSLREKKASIPVSRVQYVYMKPLSFQEYLNAVGYKFPIEIDNSKGKNKVSNPVHQKLLELVRDYTLVGGMPAAVQKFVDTNSFIECSHIHRSIIQTYQDDFGKYSSAVKHLKLKKVFDSVPRLIGGKLKYVHIDPHLKSRELKEAVELLEMAGVLYRVCQTGGEPPISAGVKQNHYKPLFPDIGLMNHTYDAMLHHVPKHQFGPHFSDAVAEQFVGQELLAYQSPLEKPKLFYWHREAKNSNAEIDYLVSYKGARLPIEVKAGATGRLKSLHMFIDKYKLKKGYRISSLPFQTEGDIISIPFYGVEQLYKMAVG